MKSNKSGENLPAPEIRPPPPAIPPARDSQLTPLMRQIEARLTEAEKLLVEVFQMMSFGKCSNPDCKRCDLMSRIKAFENSKPK